MAVEVAAKKAAEIAAKRAEAVKKVEKAKGELKTKLGYLESSIRNGQETGRNRSDVKYAANALEKAQRELDRLK